MRGLRVAVYTDYAYHRVGDEIFAERAFALFLAALADELGGLTVIGRLDPNPTKARYSLGSAIDFVPLPYYGALTEPLPAARGMAGSLLRFWRSLGGVDRVWLLGPHPVAFPFAALARLRGRGIALGVRQDTPSYVRNRHPDRRAVQAVAGLLEHGFRALGRRCPVVAVGPQIADNYRHSKQLLEIAVSLVREKTIVDPAVADLKRYDDDELWALSVGRLEEEKNPLLLADALAALLRLDARWRLRICGEGALKEALEDRLTELGIADRAEMRGYLELDGGLAELYRQSHALLHVSWTEGLPQVLFEAFAAGLPTVATDVGGIAAAVGDAVTLIPPGNADAAAAALAEIGEDSDLRRRLIETGVARVRAHSLETEVARTADFLTAPGAGSDQ